MPRPLKYDKILYIRTNDELIDHINKKAKIENLSPTVFVRQILEKEIIGKVLDANAIKPKKNTKISDTKEGKNNSNNDLYDQSINLIRKHHKVSISMLVDHFKINYDKAALIIEKLESLGVISEADHLGQRRVLKKK
tara:strand:+ start:1883 stop:2293 length:411 start_codon:yes stop_codon:yes gene_type:complete